MNPPVIPAENPDLIDLVKKRDRRFLVSWLTVTALTTALAVACFGLAMNAYGLLVAILLALSLILLPFLLCGGMEWITDRGFAGRVEALDFSVRLETHDTLGVVTVKGIGRKKVKRATAGEVNYCRISVLTDEGTRKTCTVRLPGDSDAFPLRKGDRVIKYRGLPCPAIVGCKTPLCVVCGHLDDDGKGECRGCGATLIVPPMDEGSLG